MEAVDRVGNKRSRMRGFYGYFSLTLDLSRRERGKQCALFAGRISNSIQVDSAKRRGLP